MPSMHLKGLQEALREKEEKMTRIEKRELSEEQQEELSIALNKVERGFNVDLTFYYSGHYVKLKGKVAEINIAYRYVVVGQTKIYFDDIYEVKMI